jgi:nitroreductase
MTSFLVTEGIDSLTTAWDVSDAQFPRNGSQQEQLRFLLWYATLAPSGHNAQPWLFGIKDQAIQLYADKSHALDRQTVPP